MLSLYFESTDAFIFIKQIEKEAEKQIQEKEEKENLYPYFLVMKNDYFNKRKFLYFEEIKNYERGIDIWFMLADNFQNK